MLATPCFSPACSQPATVLLLFGGPVPSIELGKDSCLQPSKLLTPLQERTGLRNPMADETETLDRPWLASTALINRQSASARSPTASPAEWKPGSTCAVTISPSAESRPQQNPARKAWKGAA